MSRTTLGGCWATVLETPRSFSLGGEGLSEGGADQLLTHHGQPDTGDCHPQGKKEATKPQTWTISL